MPEQWFYATDDTPRGPISREELLQLDRDGVLKANSLVWREGLPRWEPWRELAPSLRSESDAEESAVCAHTGRRLPLSQMSRYGEHWVAREELDAFVQALREGRILPPTSGTLEFVGFWWRVLASTIDWAVKLIPTVICFLPYTILLIQRVAAGLDGNNPLDPFADFTGPGGTPLLLAYVGGTLAYVVISIFYDTWMVGKYGGTVGKLALGFRVVNADGSAVSYRKAFGRWAAETLDKAIWFVPALIAQALSAAALGPNPQQLTPAFFVGLGAMLGWYVVGGFPYYMAGWTREKKALHDILCSTRVVRHRR